MKAKKRNFDVLPTEEQLKEQAEEQKKKANKFDVPPTEAEKQDQSLKPGVLVIKDDEDAPHPIKSGIAENEKARLRAALLKNMEYVQKKENTKRAAKFAPGGEFSRPMYANLMGGVQVVQNSSLPTAKPAPPNTAVYVNHLPKTITWNTLDTMFNEFGKIKKIKIYRDTIGNPKGDALVTYMEPEAVEASVLKLNGFQIEPGVLISVNPANFSHKEPAANPYLAGPNDGPEGEGAAAAGSGSGGGAGGGDDGPPPDGTQEAPLAFLPEELQGHLYPVVVCHHMYLKEHLADPAFLPGLEAEMLVECSKYGEVVRLMTAPDIPYYQGAVLVSFKTWEMACACGNTMDGRFFDFRQMEVEMMGLREDRPGLPPLGVDPAKLAPPPPGPAPAPGGEGGGEGEDAGNVGGRGVDDYDEGHAGLGFSSSSGGGGGGGGGADDGTLAFLEALEQS